MCGLSRTLHRLEYVDYGHAILLDDLVALSQSPGVESRDWIISYPFSGPVWLCNVVAYLLVSLLLYIMPKIVSKPDLACQMILVKLYAILMGQCKSVQCNDFYFSVLHWKCFAATHLIVTHDSSRLVYALWIMSVVVLASSYSGCFYSILTIPVYEKAIDTVNDILDCAQDGFHRIVAPQHSSYLADFLASKEDNGVFYIIGQHINR